MERKLTITTGASWATALREAGARAEKGMAGGGYQGETLNFETPATFFSHLTPNRWAMLAELQGVGAVPVRELARRLERDVRRVHDDASALVELGLVERTEIGALVCPYVDIHVDMHVARQAA